MRRHPRRPRAIISTGDVLAADEAAQRWLLWLRLRLECGSGRAAGALRGLNRSLQRVPLRVQLRVEADGVLEDEPLVCRRRLRGVSLGEADVANRQPLAAALGPRKDGPRALPSADERLVAVPLALGGHDPLRPRSALLLGGLLLDADVVEPYAQLFPLVSKLALCWPSALRAPLHDHSAVPLVPGNRRHAQAAGRERRHGRERGQRQ
mmetsp:Transcript_2076/g.6232  ORF Transcript_2076/g.6232 Transcript_2076/m.6232 type:complete len:208 (-) Transcript_2076:87-710(-)